MKHDLENGTFKVQTEEYLSPQMEVIEMEIEGPILQMSGEDADRQDW